MSLKPTATFDLLNDGDMRDSQTQLDKDLKLDYSPWSNPTDCQNDDFLKRKNRIGSFSTGTFQKDRDFISYLFFLLRCIKQNDETETSWHVPRHLQGNIWGSNRNQT